jgi:hypothetical protein
VKTAFVSFGFGFFSVGLAYVLAGVKEGMKATKNIFLLVTVVFKL